MFGNMTTSELRCGSGATMTPAILGPWSDHGVIISVNHHAHLVRISYEHFVYIPIHISKERSPPSFKIMDVDGN